jgi:molecular chaperone IbpA
MREFDLAPFARSTVGFDHMFSLLERASDATSGFPPYNIERSD